MFRQLPLFVAAAAVTGAVLTFGAGPAGAFVTFETGQVRPVAMSEDGQRLYVCNTPDNTLEIFDIAGGTLSHRKSVPVGLEPLSVAVRNAGEVWVVNHLSDSVSVLDVADPDDARVTRTLLVGDEPRDIVFAGASGNRAFITTAHRGQNIGFDPQFTTEGIGRADVWVFDADNLGTSLGGDELTVITLFGDTPRPLAVSPDGSRVYAGVFHSGNQSTIVSEGSVPNGGQGNGGLPLPNTNVSGDPGPEVGLIVKYNGSQWVDELNRNWSSFIKFDLPDYDVFAIDADANPPAQLAGTAGRFPHVGTILFNMAVNPADGKVFVSNLESFNEVRFEGPGTFAGSTVRSHIAESRISIIDPVAETVATRHLNKHIDYDTCCNPLPNPTNEASLAFPLEMAFSSDGSTLYVSAFGSSKIGVFDTAELSSDTFVPSSSSHIELSGGGPTGLVLDEANSRAYVLTRFDNSVSVVSTATGAEVDHIALHNPEPDNVVEGRPFLYDARLTSSNGDQACASCHIFGDFDSLAWDLGNPDDPEELNNPGPFTLRGNLFIDEDHHPMKGPMTTQSLRGMDNHGPMHWRGDRTGGNDEPSQQPDQGAFDEQAAFKAFNPAFVGLIGRSEELTDEQMQAFTDFILDVMYPPNPVRALDNSLTPDQSNANGLFFSRISDTVEECNGCHVTSRTGNAQFGVKHPGFFGGDGRSSFENETQMFKIAHLRNLYQKVGMFGMAQVAFVNPGDNGHKGEQVRGFGFLHDGSIDTIFRFFQATVFNDGGNTGFQSDAERRQFEQLMLAFDTNLFPVVGQQATRSDTSGSDVESRITLFEARADLEEADVVAKGVVGGEPRGWVYVGDGDYQSDRAGDATIDSATLRALADTPGQEITFTAVPPGEGTRIGVDRDLDGFYDQDEVENGGDPADATSLPCMSTDSGFAFTKAALLDDKGRMTFKATISLTELDGDSLELSAADGGGAIMDESLAAESFELAGTKLKYKAPKDSTGIVKAMIKPLSTPGTYGVSLKVSDAWTPPAADETPATTTVLLNVGGECFEGLATTVK
ncbi:MAG TPA: SMP-30/gluconolactonase/LRE family protein [Candidatus Limnocylindrales bacterium]|nr:SMP-30/gluconolactonase/LRE family protein [Candidatus Limnocylindrales bacterium]